MMEPLRKCKCGTVAYTTEDLELFTKGAKSKYGRVNKCKACRAIEDTERNKRPEVKAKKSETSRKYRKRPEIKGKLAKYNEKYRKRPENKARVLEYHKEYFKCPKNRAKRVGYNKKYLESKKITPIDYQPEQPTITKLKIKRI